MREFFEVRKRDNGEGFYTLTDDAPEWLRDAVMAAHGEESPNDWRYDMCDSIADRIDDIGDALTDDDAHEIADGLVDIWNAGRTAWLAGDLSRATYVDDAVSECIGDGSSIIDMIGVGQYLCLRDMASVLIAAQLENGGES